MLQPHPTIETIDTIERPTQSAKTLGYRMPAEFEPVECIWVVPPHNDETWPGCFEAAQAQHADWVDLMRPHVEVRTPGSLGIDTNDSWIRDFGPVQVREPGGRSRWLDADYYASRPDDDEVPRTLGALFDRLGGRAADELTPATAERLGHRSVRAEGLAPSGRREGPGLDRCQSCETRT